jgi:creatinine amidohydrolase
MARLRSIWLQELTWEDVANYLKTEDIVIFPVGSTEQHGPAGPLGLDSYAAAIPHIIWIFQALSH